MREKYNRFGRGGAYTCHLCKKRTRDTGEGEASAELCKRCYVTEGVRNGHSDNDHPGDFETCRPCLANLKSYGL